ncbi:dienelactone hydrolase family protein [Pyrenophora tritici-repentis Pt-1C-BFP]|uniref:Dienelactone hydrolase family protein n=1 Tax=Pyrenophora tritici-repentis (strain Pt-1C-BFP) TaxID=426418 RepID=B2WAU2_PYRTR|nr:dienelactone hydrolase family protein [Pyrenophora tritici-repentis Pt-1C-BFP]EDU50324.1 dienelactone hydrolase family protein [Pyrenophora tritici-repentis Pt-1C-BFP]
MLITETHKDVPTKAGGDMRIFIFHPTVPNYPKAKFPGVVVFSEIYQVTGPVARFARQIASQGYIVAAPSSYHEFTGPEALAYDGPGTDKGNEWKITKTVEAYDEDATLSVDTLLDMPTCNGRVGATDAFIRDELSKGRYDAALSGICFEMLKELFNRTLRSDLGPRSGGDVEIEDVC